MSVTPCWWQWYSGTSSWKLPHLTWFMPRGQTQSDDCPQGSLCLTHHHHQHHLCLYHSYHRAPQGISGPRAGSPRGKGPLYSQPTSSITTGDPQSSGPLAGLGKGLVFEPNEGNRGGGQDPLKLPRIKTIQRECWVKNCYKIIVRNGSKRGRINVFVTHSEYQPGAGIDEDPRLWVQIPAPHPTPPHPHVLAM